MDQDLKWRYCLENDYYYLICLRTGQTQIILWMLVPNSYREKDYEIIAILKYYSHGVKSFLHVFH